MNIYEAMRAIKAGKKVYRDAWNESFIYYVPAASYPAQTNVAKELFQDKLVPYAEYIAIYNILECIVRIYQPTQEDILAEDWDCYA